VLLFCDSEIVLERHKCVTSDYLADDNANLNDFVNAEIRRLEEQTAKLKRQMAQMKRSDDGNGHAKKRTGWNIGASAKRLIN